MKRKRRAFLGISIIFGTIAVGSLIRSLDRPSIASLPGIDIVRLVAAGMCLGGALVAFFLFVFVRDRDPN
jgi:hypothetical protein